MKIKRVDRSEMLKNSGCKNCQWPVIHCCCNDEMSDGEFGDWDYWVYCSNKGCKNHQGQGQFQDAISWIFFED